MQNSMVTTALTLPGYVVLKNCGVVRGITVRSRSIVGNFLGGLQSIFGGNISIYTSLCERARNDTYRLMCEHAEQLGANAIIGLRYDATELMAGLTEVLCYGSAVVVMAETTNLTEDLPYGAAGTAQPDATGKTKAEGSYGKLLLACGGDVAQAARLISFEKSRDALIDQEEAIRRALALL